MNFTAEEQATIVRLSVVGGWDHSDAAPLKAKLRPYLLTRTAHCCCYCRREMHEWHMLTIDTEHILPKGNGLYPQFSFELRNLSISCKRCNMSIKRSDTSFYIGNLGEEGLFESEHYSFIHPNLDNVNEHLAILLIQYNQSLMVKYQTVNNSAKGANTYTYFQLAKLEMNSFDEAQGLNEISPSEELPPELAQELTAVLDTIAPL